MSIFRNKSSNIKPVNIKPDSGEYPDELYLPLLPLRDIVVFPHMVAPLFVGREKSVRALAEAMNSEKRVFLATQKKRMWINLPGKISAGWEPSVR